MTLAVAVEGIGLGGLIGIFVPLAGAIVAIVLLPAQRAKLVGESLGDAVEDLRTENNALREERNAFRDERDAATVNLAVKTEELRLIKQKLEAAVSRLAALGEPPP